MISSENQYLETLADFQCDFMLAGRVGMDDYFQNGLGAAEFMEPGAYEGLSDDDIATTAWELLDEFLSDGRLPGDDEDYNVELGDDKVRLQVWCERSEDFLDMLTIEW